jgi:hypothetical protein
LIASDDSSGDDLYSLLDFGRRGRRSDQLAAGTYFIKVNEDGNDATIDRYFLRLLDLSESPVADTYEEDNTIATAKTIADDEFQQRSFHVDGDQDFARFDLPYEATVTIATVGQYSPPYGGNTVMTLYDASGNTIVENDDGGPDTYSLISNRTLSAGTYFIGLNEYNNNSTINAYVLSLDVTYTDPIVEFVARFYRQCLSRAPDAGGLNAWAESLRSGSNTGTGLALGFVLSQEFLNRNLSDSQFLDTLYRSFFNREPDAGGKAVWQGELDRGVLREDVLYGFLRSAEFAALTQTFGITTSNQVDDQRYNVHQFVRRFYQQCLSREPDAAGIASWRDALISGELFGGQAARGFVLSDEFINRGLSNADFMNVLYRAFFNRDPDPTGFTVWTDALGSGTSRADVLQGFISAQEFLNLTQSFGIMADGVNG